MSIQITEIGLAPHFVDYREAWVQQQKLHDAVAAGLAPSTVLLLEHQSVYTAGKRTEPQERPNTGSPVVDVDRGGKLTWHGPGQLVAYPILKLAEPHKVKDYVYQLEEIILATLARFEIRGQRVAGRAGIWLPADPQTGQLERKIAAIGIKVHDGVSMHGIAINCSNSLAPYAQIIPCGISDAGVTTASLEAGHTITPQLMAPILREEILQRETLLVTNDDVTSDKTLTGDVPLVDGKRI